MSRKALTCAAVPLVAQNYRHLADAQLARGLQAQVAIYDITFDAGQT
jgi:hypothetical protein